MLTLDYIQDPGHGWISAPIEQINALGLNPTPYSYRDGETVYLEEDCDAPAYLRALTRAGIAYSIRETHTRGDAWIRRLPRFEG